ncbi:hypothetical protein RB195_026469 [Necator americanus]|uniref:DUF7778 domain-containing protein n=1 Tax=Necator americanus TaxID=51031 RepID=A0ABR1EX21_NECAM
MRFTRTFFRRTGKITKYQLSLTNKDTLIIYKTSENGLILSLNSVRKTSVTTQTVTMNTGRVLLVCRYRIVFDFGTLNIFLINDAIHRWRVALDEVIDKYSRLYYELPEESNTVSEKQGCLSPRCQETQKSTPCNDSVVCTGTPSKLTLETEPSRRSSVGSPYISSSSKDVSAREPLQSVRRGKRSVASLRARIQRKICATSSLRPFKSKQSVEPSKACQVYERELLQMPRLVPPMRKRRSNDTIEPLVVMSETSATSVPPLPSNPPPSLSCTNQHNSSKQEEVDAASPPKNVSFKTALTSSSYQKPNNSDVMLSLCTTPSASSEYPEDANTAISEKSAISKKSVKVNQAPASANVLTHLIGDNPDDSEIVQDSGIENQITPMKPMRYFTRTSAVLETGDSRLSSSKTDPPTKILVTSAVAEETPDAPAKPLRPLIVPFTIKKPHLLARPNIFATPIRPPRGREAVHFSISPYQSGDEDNSPNESRSHEKTSLPNTAEDVLLDAVNQAEHPENTESIPSGESENEDWQNSQMA